MCARRRKRKRYVAALFCNLDQILGDVNVIVMIDDNFQPRKFHFKHLLWDEVNSSSNRINISHKSVVISFCLAIIHGKRPKKMQCSLVLGLSFLINIRKTIISRKYLLLESKHSNTHYPSPIFKWKKSSHSVDTQSYMKSPHRKFCFQSSLFFSLYRCNGKIKPI